MKRTATLLGAVALIVSSPGCRKRIDDQPLVGDLLPSEGRNKKKLIEKMKTRPEFQHAYIEAAPSTNMKSTMTAEPRRAR